ncbi:MAG: hypothetical protein NTW61_08705, partial [Candidatus Melainabacteria bacterium]|nr:hypothetical protein [Candidatus Melainabacteria bacterium]
QWVWNGKEDSHITAHNINKVRESLKKENVKDLGLLPADGSLPTIVDVLQMLVYLDNALVNKGKRTGDGEKMLSIEQLEEAFSEDIKKGGPLYKIKSS